MEKQIWAALCFFIWILLTAKFLKADEGKIIGGKVVQAGEFPYQLCMWGDVRCGGALVTLRQFMTAAHCLVKKYKDSTKHTDLTTHFMVAGVVDCTKTDDPFYQKRNIKDYKMHKEYRKKKDMTSYHDFAVGILEKPFTESERVKVGVLPSTDPAKFRQLWLDFLGSGKTCSVMGFGTNTEPLVKDYTNILKVSMMRPKNDKYCKGTLVYDSDTMLDGEICCVPVDASAESMGVGDAGSAIICDGLLYGVNTGGYFQPGYNLQLFTLAYPYLDLFEKESSPGFGYVFRSYPMAVISGIFIVLVVHTLQR
ncbi:trypsin beta-like [Cimex lectularius]|uniref:Peptidase S1 domain-containing protein n=1 Tax=Cimex lectularius TaxID=79782 RepID=A0A8I6TCU5_CIMLE|nr:trypsin beta-like [Cimex lectularius]